MIKSERLKEVELSGIRRLFELANKKGGNIINLGLGEPDFNPPEPIVEELAIAAKKGLNKYGPTNGIDSLKQIIVDKYKDYDPNIKLDNVIITEGSTQGLFSVALSIFNRGNEVLVPDPGFVLYSAHVKIAEATPIFYNLTKKTSYLPDIKELEKIVTEKTVAIYINNPSNPLGTVYPESLVDKIVDFAKKHDLVIISDEVYDKIIYEGKFNSFWGKYDKVILTNSFSKIIAVPGWRIAYLLVPDEFLDPIKKMHYYTVACPSTPFQHAIVNGWERSQSRIEEMVKIFKERRDLVVKMLHDMGVDYITPQGAFYVFMKIPENMKKSSKQAAEELINYGVLVTSGDSFGSNGEGYLRISFANSSENIKKGLNLIDRWIKDNT
ncbi:MAG: pyridoxal phosphate-dependent aminotransferase [Thermoplasmata archaeon]